MSVNATRNSWIHRSTTGCNAITSDAAALCFRSVFKLTDSNTHAVNRANRHWCVNMRSRWQLDPHSQCDVRQLYMQLKRPSRQLNICVNPQYCHDLIDASHAFHIPHYCWRSGKSRKSALLSFRLQQPRHSCSREEDSSLPASVLLMIKRPGQHSTHNLCVKAPFLNATKGQEVVIHRRNYGCKRRPAQ